VYSKIRKTFHAAFWKSLSDNLRLDPPCYIRVLRVMGEIRDGIADLATPTCAWEGATQINDVIDIAHIKDMIQDKAFDWTSCVKKIKDTMTVIASFYGGASTMSAKVSIDTENKSTWADIQIAMDEARMDHTKIPGSCCDALCCLLDHVKAVRIEVLTTKTIFIRMRNHVTAS
jgi:hypothetical protein